MFVSRFQGERRRTMNPHKQHNNKLYSMTAKLSTNGHDSQDYRNDILAGDLCLSNPLSRYIATASTYISASNRESKQLYVILSSIIF